MLRTTSLNYQNDSRKERTYVRALEDPQDLVLTTELGGLPRWCEW